MSRRREYIGIVVSDKMQKTIVVRVSTMRKDAKYGRMIKRATSYKVHDEKGAAKAGDEVKIQECRPLSKDKRFRLIGLMKKAEKPAVELSEPAVS